MADEEKSVSSSGGGNKLLVILTAVNLLITLGIVGVLFTSFQKEKAKQGINDISTQDHGAPGEGEDGHGGEGKDSGPAVIPDFGKMITLEQFTVNLAGTGSSTSRFARVNISIEVPSDDTESELNQKMPQVRNTIIDLFNTKRPNDLSNPDGRNDLKYEILQAINGFLVTGKVKGVFFTNFALST